MLWENKQYVRYADNNAPIIKEMEEHLFEIGSWQGEIRLLKKSGQSYPVFLSISSVADRQKIIRQYTYSFIEKGLP